MTNRRYTVPAGWLIVSDDIAKGLSMLLEPGRRSFGSHVDRHPDLRQWLAELDAIVPHTTIETPVAAVWISTAEAANLLGLKPRYTRTLAGKIRSELHGRSLMFAVDAVLDEVEARAAAATAPAGRPCDAEHVG